MPYTHILADLIDYVDTEIVILQRPKLQTHEISVVWQNKKFEESAGYRLEDLKGENALSFIRPGIAEGTQERAMHKLRNFDDCRTRIRIDTVSGEEYTAWLKAFPVKDESDEFEFLVLVIESTAGNVNQQHTLWENREDDGSISQVPALPDSVRANERFLRSSVAAAGIGLWEWHVPSSEVLYSPEWFTMLGYGPNDYPSGFDTFELLAHPEDTADILKKADNAFVGHVDEYEGRFRMKCKDGSWKWVKATGHVTERDETGKAVRIFGTHIDITDDVVRETALKTALARAEEAKRSKERFLAVMSHEIRTPLNGVLGMLDFVLDTELDANQRDFLKVANVSAKNLLSILNDTLDYSKLEAGAMDVDEAPFSMAEIVNNVVALFTARAVEKSVDLKTELDPALPAQLLGDSNKIRQILMNLVGNAVKFTPEGSVTIRVRVAGIEHDKHLVRIEVEDTGVGIPDTAKGIVFDSFSQADASTSRRFGGTGLGLAITKKMTELLDGSIDFTSQIDIGTRFNLMLPLALPDEASLPDATDNQTRTLRFKSEKGVLIVEDHPINQRIIRRYLAKSSLRSDIANNGKEALEMALAKDYDLILMDIQMPIMDGVETTKAIRAANGCNAEAPIIALTANAIAGDRELYLQKGMTDYITKPIDKTELMELLARYLPCEEEVGGGDNGDNDDGDQLFRPEAATGQSNQDAALDELLQTL